MTSIRCLRAFRPSVSAGGRPVLGRAFHIGRAGHTSRLLQEDGPEKPGAANVGARRRDGGSEFEKLRFKALEELRTNEELYTEPYPRLEPRQRRRSIVSFKQKYQSVAKQDGTEEPDLEILYGTLPAASHAAAVDFRC